MSTGVNWFLVSTDIFLMGVVLWVLAWCKELVNQRQLYRDELAGRPMVENRYRYKTKKVQVLTSELMQAGKPDYIMDTYFQKWYEEILRHFATEGPLEFATEVLPNKDYYIVWGKVKVIGERSEY